MKPGRLDANSYQRKMSDRCNQTCRIEIAGQPVGTGFLIGPDLVLTARHVIDRSVQRLPESPDRSKIVVRIAESDLPYMLAADWLVDASPAGSPLDFAILRVEARPAGDSSSVEQGASRRGWIDLGTEVAESFVGALLIFHHAEGGELQISPADQLRSPSSSTSSIEYSADTSGGSSGAPCFDLALRLVALHQAPGRGTSIVSIIAASQSAELQGARNALLADLAAAPREVTNEIKHEHASVPHRPRIVELLSAGEHGRVAFQESLFPIRRGAIDHDPKVRFIQSVAALSNTDGGSVVLGATIERGPIGIQSELESAGAVAAYKRRIRRLLQSKLRDFPVDRLCRIEQHVFGTSNLIEVQVDPSGTPIYYRDRLFVRAEADTVELRGPHIVAFAEKRKRIRWNALENCPTSAWS